MLNLLYVKDNILKEDVVAKKKKQKEEPFRKFWENGEPSWKIKQKDQGVQEIHGQHLWMKK